MGSRSGFDADLDLIELGFSIDNGSGAIPIGVRQTNAATNLGELTLFAGANVALTNNITTAQNMFAANHSSLGLQPNTAYIFELQAFVDTGATTHTTAFDLAVSGGSIASIQYESSVQGITSGTINTTAPSTLDVATANATVLNATSAATTTYMFLTGQLVTGSLTGAATVISVTPQITFSAGPTGTCQTRKGSYAIFWPVVSQ